MSKETLTVTNDDDEEIIIPSKYEVCGRCDGKGVHDHPAFSNGITQEEFDEDPDFREDYFDGRYDVKCEECDGLRVVLVPDEERMNEEQKKAWASHERYLSELRHERYLRSRGIEY